MSFFRALWVLCCFCGRYLLPSQVPLDQFFNVNVNIGNEFGLFRRDYVQSGEHIYLQCSLRSNSAGRYRLAFQEPLDASDDGDGGSADASGKVALNDRGKASFRVAVVVAEASKFVDTTTSVALQGRVHESSRETWNLFPVVSLPFTVVPPGGELKEGLTGDLGVHCCRAVAMDGLRHDILLAESPGNLGKYLLLLVRTSTLESIVSKLMLGDSALVII
ncbi:unnamed protein product [Phytophthora fragariaefolia]|uniref:Unnamed protein product n=1 Tax=Phytophthora fragariaefolia TaxID=1490495 RepID=A0A9W6U217_9STRA|nr:unnamed protein product [Phytophthora fragariaefolia]